MKFSSFALIAIFSSLVVAAPWNDKSKSSKSKVALNIFDFTSTYQANATPDQVVNANNTATPGEPGASGTYFFGINAPKNVICYNITVFISGNYSSLARTATHIHQAAVGKAGPPRIAFPNPIITSPVDVFGRRVSIGCLTGPFETGILSNGTDTGAGFTVSQIEANPSGFFADVHTGKFTVGAIRGQIKQTGKYC